MTSLTRSGNRILVGRDLPRPYRPSVGPTQASYAMVTGSFQRAQQPGRGVDHPPPI